MRAVVDELASRRQIKLEAELTGPRPSALLQALEEMDQLLVRYLNRIDGELLTSAEDARMFALRLDRLVLDQLSAERDRQEAR